MNFPVYHKDLNNLHVRTLPPRAYFVPFELREKALYGTRDDSLYFHSLCGLWKFKFFKSFEDIDCDFFAEAFDISDLSEKNVPSCFQLYDEGAFDKPLYSNLMYPFSTDPPHVPDENPCAVYIKELDLSENLLKRKNILTFEGVASCFYVWVNGEFTGYSQVSHCVSEFDISEKLKEGKNRICVLVVKWCDGSYLEDQDFFRLSGIFREVYITSRNENYISDIEIKQKFSPDFSNAYLNVSYCSEKEKSVKYELISPDGEVCARGEASRDFVIEISSPVLWNDEEPLSYMLIISDGDEIIPLRVSLCKKEIKDKKLLINGKAVKLRGINRHDSNAENGYVVTVPQMLDDLMLLKRANVNAIRTSHYPNDPRFIELCEKTGFYLINEADLETHGMGYNTKDDWDWTRWSMLSTVPEWKEAYVDRAARLYERDKNSGCVIMWSLGNESGCGVNHRAMRQYIKSRDENAIVHYENAHLEFKAVPEGECFADISDVESRMYAQVGYIEDYLNNESHDKPFYMCEYVCSMSTGNVYPFWELVDKYDNFCGGCIWELTDHAVNFPDENGKPRYYYGGDFGDFPNNSICCIDGMIFPDRTARPGYYDMKKVYEQFRGKYENGVLTVKSVRYFKALDDFGFNWKITCGGDVVADGSIDSLDIEPLAEKSYTLFDESALKLGENAFLTVSFYLNSDTEWAEKGYETGFLQFELNGVKCEKEKEINEISFVESYRYVNISCGKNEYVFDKSYGRIESIKRNGIELLAAPSRFKLWHAPTYNMGSLDNWLLNHYDHIVQKTYSADVKKIGDDVVIDTKIALGSAANPPVVKMNVKYTFKVCGSFDIDACGTVRENAPVLPRLGIEFILKEENEHITYFGLGEHESYPDRFQACRFGEYSLDVSDNFVHYVRPQENSSHYKTRFVKLYGEKTGLYAKGKGIDDFSFNASHYSAEQLTEKKHDFELDNEHVTYFNLDWRFNAIAEDSDLNNSENKRLLNDKEFTFGFTVEPVDCE